MKKILSLIIFLAAFGVASNAAKPKTPEKNYGELARNAYLDYRLDDADEYLSDWEAQLRKKKQSAPAELTDLRNKVRMMQNMLERVEKIAIIDSIVVDKDEFFKHYKLSREAGKLLDHSVLASQYVNGEPAVVYIPETKHEVFWSNEGEDGFLEIVSAQILDDGTFLEPEKLGDVLNEGGDADYMYMTSDGTTFYFANNGENSIGGYDIFLSRRSADGDVLQPQNIGMPYNSPYDDYMLVIDEGAGLGWWATDRNQLGDQITIYVFVPNDTRVNYDPEDEDIESYAKIESIDVTVDDTSLRSRLTDNPALSDADAKAAGGEQFEIAMGNGKVYTSLNDFKNTQARQMMSKYLELLATQKQMDGQLAAHRRAYAKGDKSVASDIAVLEKRLNATYPALTRMRNQIITLETR